MPRTQRNVSWKFVVFRRAFILLGLATLIVLEQVVTDKALSLYFDALYGIQTPFHRLLSPEIPSSKDDNDDDDGDILLQMPFEMDQNRSRSLKWFSLRTKHQIRNSMTEAFNISEAKKFKTRSRILAIGGTTTWGRTFEEKKSSFPTLLSKMLGRRWKASDIVIRAADADYGSQCIESMIRDSMETINDMVEPFDIIFLEFSLGSLNGIHLLLERLRRRYPDAVIIYVHLWSLGRATETEPTDVLCNATDCRKAYEHISELQQKGQGKLRRLKGKTFRRLQQHANTTANNTTRPTNMTNLQGNEWSFSRKMLHQTKQQSQHVKRALNKVEGIMYELPMPETPHTALSSSWFDSDLHHLSGGGHRFLADQIYHMLKTSNMTSYLGTTTEAAASNNNSLQDGTWGKGDQCISWIEDGGKSIAAHFKGGTIREFGKPTKYALHIGGQDYDNSSSIYFDNNSEEDQPVRLEIMSYSDGTYPKAQIQLLNNQQQHNNQTKNNDTNTSVVDYYYELDPVHPNPLERIYHIPRSAHVDWVKPGRNKITIQTVGETKVQPLRVTGLIMCGACHEMGAGKTNLPTKKKKVDGTARPTLLARS